jgi:hypothetical protein
MASEKSKKALDFSTFNFQYCFLAVYIASEKSGFQRRQQPPLLVFLAIYLRAMYRNMAKFLQIWSNYGY